MHKRKVLLFLSLFPLISSCVNNSGKKLKLNDNVVDSILHVNQNELAFMSFYPNMDDDIFDFIVRREMRNGKVSINTFNEDIFWPEYRFIIDNDTKVNFMIFNSRNKIQLYDVRTFTMPKGSKVYEVHIRNVKKEYDKILNKLILVFIEKYGSFQFKKEEDFLESFKFENERKVVVLKGDCSIHEYMIEDDVGDLTYASYRIEIDFYSKQSFELEQQKIRADSISEYNEEVQKKIREQEKARNQRKELIDDI